MNRLFLFPVLLMLAACSTQNSNVRVTAEQPPAPPPKAVPQARNEPVFYNGKTYQLRFAPSATAGSYAMSVQGMTAGQAKDAEAVATSSLRYFACKEGMTGKLSMRPRYDGKLWHMTAHCA